MTDRISADHRPGWGWILAYGVLLVLVGLLALLSPLATGLAVGVLMAIVLVLGGVAALAAGLSRRGWHSHWLDIVVGLLCLVFGALILWQPFVGALSLVWAIGVWLALLGIIELAAASRSRHHRGRLILLGIVDVVLGAWLFLSSPATALIALSVLVGLSFVIRGLILASWAFTRRRALA